MGHRQLDISNKTAVIIGGTSGIGLTLARGMVQAGANVVATGRRADLVEQVCAEVKNLGRRSLAQTCDVTDRSSVQDLLDAVVREFGAIDILVTCAGRSKRPACSHRRKLSRRGRRARTS